MDVVLKKFYSFFWNSKTCRNIFLLHKEDLLEKNSIDLKITDYYLPRIVLSNSVKQKAFESKISTRSENKLIELFHNLNISEKKYLDSSRFDNFLEKKFGKSMSMISEDYPDMGILGLGLELILNLGNEDEVLSDLKEYHIINSEINNYDELFEFLGKMLIDEATLFLKKEEMYEILSSIDDISDIYNSVIKSGLIEANKQISDIRLEQDSYQNRIDVFETLYEKGVLDGGYFKSYVECFNCPPNTYSGYLSCNIPPNKLKFKCPNCNKESYYMVPYRIYKGLFSHITNVDGVLSFAISYYLEEYKIENQRNISLEGLNEIDFVLYEDGLVTGIIEVKMFKLDRSFDVKLKNLKSAISQMKKTLNKLRNIKEEYGTIQTLIVANYTDEKLYSKLYEECSQDIETYNLLIHSPDKFKESI